MARKFYTVERKDTAEGIVKAGEMHRLAKAYQYQHGYASEFEALYALLSKKQGKEKEEREEKKVRLTGTHGRSGNRGGRSGATVPEIQKHSGTQQSNGARI